MRLEFEAQLPRRGLDLRFAVAGGETLAIVGPNGAGKSSVLALLAGLLHTDKGRAAIGETVLFNGRRRLPAHRRGVGLLAQEPSLFPHFTVLKNVAFGLRSTGTPRRLAYERAEAALAGADAHNLIDRLPAELSGGQAQRVALVRALVARPRLLLLDEPFAALDIGMASRMRSQLRRSAGSLTTILVSHDAADVRALADQVIVLDEGKIVEQGPPCTVFGRPLSAFGAQFGGTNLLEGVLRDGKIHLLDGILATKVQPPQAAEGTAVRVLISPSDLDPKLADERAPDQGVLRARVIEAERNGELVRLITPHFVSDIAAHRAPEIDNFLDALVDFRVDAEKVITYTSTNGRS
ncbi:molybdate transport system ATP-binding protein [Microbacterium sp. SORGH_AS 1204]|uniref:sulfate/molybdate ABC transporter ATP-binding protein n=1 Tax=Microbacterium sp. SORGH_AS_1204 TaxID=3041785 RepID=UPI0027916476|nr:ATP-binding cassette domain-containing protein [Microbacterium sp. SORGH_AS_1204]MDQ1137781.1 molybdate transport system ATP-binding protein [Microbacterium sp. SORGH_AS_1204]